MFKNLTNFKKKFIILKIYLSLHILKMSSFKKLALSTAVAASIAAPGAMTQNKTDSLNMNDDIAEVLATNSWDGFDEKTISLEKIINTNSIEFGNPSLLIENSRKWKEIVKNMIDYYGEDEFENRMNSMMQEIEENTEYELLRYCINNKKLSEESVKQLSNDAGIEKLIYKYYGEFFVDSTKLEQEMKDKVLYIGIAILGILISAAWIAAWQVRRDQKK